jgi:hypothetical protein
MKIKIPIAAVIILGFIYFSNKVEIDKMFSSDQPAMCEVCEDECPCVDEKCICENACDCSDCKDTA